MFESFTPTRASWKRRTLFVGSIVFHACAAIGLLIWSVLHVEELAPPEVTLTFFNAPPPPPPAQQKKASTKPKIVPSRVISAFKDPKPTPKEETPEPDNNSGGVAGGVVGGVTGGVVGGVVGAPATSAPPPPPPPPAPPRMVPSFVFDKERISSPDPHLPDEFKDRHPKQTLNATYRLCVGTDGRITEVAVVHGIGGVDDAILKQIRATWAYKPQPLPVCSVRVFLFKIN